MKKREAFNLALHIGGGAAMAAAVWWRPWMIVLVVFVFAWLREQAQHRWILEGEPGAISTSGRKLYRAEKRTFFDFGWMTGHRIWEVFQWVIGAAVAVGIWLAREAVL